jgi:hypothetical protein
MKLERPSANQLSFSATLILKISGPTAVVFAAAVLTLGLFASPANAQSRGGGHGSAVGGHGHGGLAAGGRARFGRSLRSSDGYIFYPDFYDYGYDSGYDYGGPQAAPVQVVYEQAPAATAQATAPKQPVQALILENHDGQWVRVPTGNELPVSARSSSDYAVSGAHPGLLENKQAAAPEKLPPVTLVFRNGHQEQVAKYTIHGNALYTGADYWSTGSWSRRIPLAELDLQSTERLNAQNGAKFNLPSGPNEVVVHF